MENVTPEVNLTPAEVSPLTESQKLELAMLQRKHLSLKLELIEAEAAIQAAFLRTAAANKIDVTRYGLNESFEIVPVKRING